MKKTIVNLLMLLFGLFLMTSCNMSNVEEGTVGLAIKRPYFLGSDGVEVLAPGRHTIAWSTSLVPVDVKPFKVKEEFDDLTVRDNIAVDFDIYFTIQPLATRVDTLYSGFGLDYYVKLLEQELRNLTRDKCKQYDMTPLTNDVKVSMEINQFVLEEGNKIIKKLKIPVRLIAVNMGAVNPPKDVIDERSRTATAKQREQTILQEIQNEKQRQTQETERAKSDKAYQQNLNLSTSEYIKLKELEVKKIGYSNATNITIIEGNVGLNKQIQ